MAAIQFGIIGGGWRAEFYLRIAKALPEQFQIKGMLVRDQDKAATIEQSWNVQTYQTLDAFLEHQPYAFVVLSVPWAASPAYLMELARRNVPVLAETPPAPDIESLVHLYEAVGENAKYQLSDDEIAIATSLLRMGNYVQGGPSFYSLAEASQDHYLSILMKEAIKTGTIVKTTKQIWADEK